MKNKNQFLFLIALGATLMITGCTPGGAVEESDRTVETQTSNDFSLKAIITEVPELPDIGNVFVEKVEGPEKEVVQEIIKDYSDFSSERYEDLKGDLPFVLFFTKEESCDRCKQLNDFLSRNLSVLPNYTQVMRVTWDQYPNLQTELSARRPATMVFFNADGSVADTLFAPPIDRIKNFFEEYKP